MYNNKRIYLRSYNLVKDKIMLAVQPRPASFSEQQNSYQVSKNGYIQIDFTPVEEGNSSQILTHSKRTFILLLKNVGDILDLDTTLPFDAELDEEGTYIQYHNKETEPIKVLRMNKVRDAKRTYRFTYCEVSQNETGEGTPQNVSGIDLSYGEVRNLQALIEYAIPILLGWHCIYNPSVVSNSTTL